MVHRSPTRPEASDPIAHFPVADPASDAVAAATPGMADSATLEPAIETESRLKQPNHSGPECPASSGGCAHDHAQCNGQGQVHSSHSRHNADHDHSHTDPASGWRHLRDSLVCLGLVISGVVIETAWPSGYWLAVAAYLGAYLAGGHAILRSAVSDLLAGRVEIDLLMVLAALGTAVLGHWADGGWLLFLFSLSHGLEALILGRTRSAIEQLLDLAPESATVRRGGVEQRILATELVAGDEVIVHPGERISADGCVRVGNSTVDQSAVTGESVPVDKQPGDHVFAGTLNQVGVFEFVVERPPGQTTLDRMVQLVTAAQSDRSASRKISRWFGQTYTWLVIVACLVTGLWSGLVLGRSLAAAFTLAVTVLVIASPCAVVISIPAAMLAAIARGARQGILFKSSVDLEQTGRLTAVAFDKTGTLTWGQPRLVGLIADEAADASARHGSSGANLTDLTPAEAALLQLAASIEAHSEHPLAKAIVREATDRGIRFEPADNTTALIGQGVTGRIAGREYFLGKLGAATATWPVASARVQQQVAHWQEQGWSVMWLKTPEASMGALAVADRLRPSAAAAIAGLRQLGIDRLTILSGDHQRVADAVGGTLGLEARAELLPEDKLVWIREQQQQGQVVGMMGDGMNDAPSLATADVGISLSATGTAIALETADVVLMGDDLTKLPVAVDLARRTQQVIRQNLVFAFGVMAAMLAAAALTTLPLPAAVFGHEGGTVLVILNGLRLLLFPGRAFGVTGSLGEPQTAR